MKNSLIALPIAAALTLVATPAPAHDDPKKLQCDAIVEGYHKVRHRMSELERETPRPRTHYGPLANVILAPFILANQAQPNGISNRRDIYQAELRAILARARAEDCEI